MTHVHRNQTFQKHHAPSISASHVAKQPMHGSHVQRRAAAATVYVSTSGNTVEYIENQLHPKSFAALILPLALGFATTITSSPKKTHNENPDVVNNHQSHATTLYA